MSHSLGQVLFALWQVKIGVWWPGGQVKLDSKDAWALMESQNVRLQDERNIVVFQSGGQYLSGGKQSVLTPWASGFQNVLCAPEYVASSRRSVSQGAAKNSVARGSFLSCRAFFIFSCAVFYAAPWLTDRLEEATEYGASLSGERIKCLCSKRVVAISVLTNLLEIKRRLPCCITWFS